MRLAFDSSGTSAAPPINHILYIGLCCRIDKLNAYTVKPAQWMKGSEVVARATKVANFCLGCSSPHLAGLICFASLQIGGFRPASVVMALWVGWSSMGEWIGRCENPGVCGSTGVVGSFPPKDHIRPWTGSEPSDLSAHCKVNSAANSTKRALFLLLSSGADQGSTPYCFSQRIIPPDCSEPPPLYPTPEKRFSF